MSEMIERVAQAIRKSDIENGHCDESTTVSSYFAAATSALAAMRDPTPEMLKACAGSLKKHLDAMSKSECAERYIHRFRGGYLIPADEKAAIRYTAMIDEALR